jgi:predicted aldo/keto reductase-like oxidoreductase
MRGIMKKLGFGLMRLPQKEGQIDIEQTKKMVDRFMEAGFTYFDTAYVYPGSEVACRKVLVERYPRQSYTLATKINAWMGHPDAETCKAQLNQSLERTQAGYFDYYLLHALQRSNYKMYDDYGIWDFVKEAKEQGLIKHYGFSFHSSPDLLDKLLTEHPEVDFVQL